MEQKEKKLGFFARLKKAIFELEDYGFFLGEKLTVAFKYFFVLVFFVSIIFSFSVVYKSTDAISRAYSYVENELPEFDYKDGNLHFNNVIDAYDHDYGFSLIADTSENISEEKISEYKNKVYKQGEYGAFLLKNNVLLITPSYEDSINYAQYFASLQTADSKDTEEITFSNKEELVELMYRIGIPNMLISMFIVLAIGVYFVDVFTILGDICVVAIFGWFAARICGVGFKMNPMMSLSIYGLSLSIVLDLLFDVIYVMTGFTVQYFNVIYLLIAYVYIIAAIFMIKYDLIKHTEELKKIIEVQKQVQKDLAEEKESSKLEKESEEAEEVEKEETEDSEANKKEEVEEKKEENRDPDGSEI